MIDLSRTPVLVGAGQHTNRIEDPLAAPDPFTLLETVARAAAADAGDPGLLGRLTHVWLVNSLSLRHPDPAGELARRLGATPGEARYSGVGGAMPQWLVNRASELVLRGERPLVLVSGVEALATLKRAKRAGVRVAWPKGDGQPELWPPLEPDFGVLPAEIAHGLAQPTHMYALIESAIAAAMGHSPAEHQRWMGRLMEGLNPVAAKNPNSWFPTRRDAHELVTPTAQNRRICFPYTKYLNAVMDVDMAAAVLVTDAQTAREAGLAPDSVAYHRGWADAKDVWFVSQRPSLADSPAIAECGRTALAMAGTDLSGVSAFDLYSCFPSAVEVSMRALGVHGDDARQLTLAGGIPYHGGPGNDYVTHAIGSALARLRDRDDETVLVHGNGYFLTKHAVGVYSSEPPTALPEPAGGVQDRVDAAAAPVPVDAGACGAGHVVAYTVPFDRRDLPGSGIVLAEVGGRRTLALADDELTAELLHDGRVGSSVHISPGEPHGSATIQGG